MSKKKIIGISFGLLILLGGTYIFIVDTLPQLERKSQIDAEYAEYDENRPERLFPDEPCYYTETKTWVCP